MKCVLLKAKRVKYVLLKENKSEIRTFKRKKESEMRIFYYCYAFWSRCWSILWYFRYYLFWKTYPLAFYSYLKKSYFVRYLNELFCGITKQEIFNPNLHEFCFLPIFEIYPKTGGLGHFGRGHLGRGHYGRGHLGLGHYGRGHFGRGHLGRGHFGPLI